MACLKSMPWTTRTALATDYVGELRSADIRVITHVAHLTYPALYLKIGGFLVKPNTQVAYAVAVRLPTHNSFLFDTLCYFAPLLLCVKIKQGITLLCSTSTFNFDCKALASLGTTCHALSAHDWSISFQLFVIIILSGGTLYQKSTTPISSIPRPPCQH